MSRPPVVASGERGAATVVAVALLGVLVLVGSALSVVGAIFVAHRGAQAAADLAALAGAAQASGSGAGGDPCSAAASTAESNGASLTGCLVAGRDVRVTVAVPGPRWRGLQVTDLVAEARAGPG